MSVGTRVIADIAETQTTASRVRHGFADRAFMPVAYLCSVLSVAGAAAVALKTAVRLRHPLTSDFGVFYAAGRMAAAGHGSAVYSLSALQKVEAALNHGDNLHLVFPYAPYVAAGLGLLARLPAGVAFMVWTAGNLAAYVLAAALAVRRLPASMRALGALAVAGAIPLVVSTDQGENSGLLALGFVLILVALFRPPLGAAQNSADSRHRSLHRLLRWNVAWLITPGCMILALKPQLALVPLGLIVLRRRPNEIVAAAVALVTVAGIGLAAGGLTAYNNFARMIAQGMHWTTQYHWGPTFNYTLKATLQSFIGFGSATTAVWALLALSTLTWLFVRYHQDREAPPEAVWLVVAAVALLVTNHALFHDLLLLYPCAALALASRLRWAALAVLVAPWLDPALYGTTHTHVVVVACVGVLGVAALAGTVRGEGKRTMNQHREAQAQGRKWKLFERPQWGSASASEMRSKS